MSYTPRGIRNNNPGNINFVGQTGAVLEPKTKTVTQPRFACFPEDSSDPKSVEQAKLRGLTALRDQLIRYYDHYQLHTVKDIIGRWAPTTENNTSSYISGVAHSVGVEPTTVIAAMNATIMTGLMNAIIQFENGINPYGNLVHQVASGADYSKLIA